MKQNRDFCNFNRWIRGRFTKNWFKMGFGDFGGVKGRCGRWRGISVLTGPAPPKPCARSALSNSVVALFAICLCDFACLDLGFEELEYVVDSSLVVKATFGVVKLGECG